MGKLETKYKIGILVVVILTVLGLVPTIIYAGYGPIWSTVACIIMYLLIAAYAFFGYKKPHGNMLKYLYVLYALSLLASLVSIVQLTAVVPAVLIGVVILIIGYIAGRLDRIKQNRILMLIVLIIEIYLYGLAVAGYKPSFLGFFSVVSPVIMWLDLCLAYMLRYKQHRIFGLLDASTIFGNSMDEIEEARAIKDEEMDGASGGVNLEELKRVINDPNFK